MKLVFAICLLLVFTQAKAQPESGPRADFPIVVSIKFHSLSVPFRNMKNHFANIGIGLGTDITYGNNPHWAQRVEAVWYSNRAVGNGLMLYSQAIWRPAIGDDGFGEMKMGLGYLFSWRPVESYQRKDGQWQSVGKKGKGMLTVPLGVAGGINNRIGNSFTAPYLGYQVMAVTDYNRSVPVVTESFIEVGSRFKKD